MDFDKELLKTIDRIRTLLTLTITSVVGLVLILILWLNGSFKKAPDVARLSFDRGKVDEKIWHAPDVSSLDDEVKLKQVKYGRELIAHTSLYLGPQGIVGQISNGMNCQNCHLDAGTRPFGNNYALVAATYPKFRARSGTVESIEKRVNDCFERSLNGTALDTASEEMAALISYIKFVGTNVNASEIPLGAGMKKIQVLDRAADPLKGKQLYETQCVTCHGKNGEGVMTADGKEYQFPPLWGKYSYNIGAGLYRLSNFAQFIQFNMPLGATFENPVLSEEEAWDIAAYVNSLPRPFKDLSADWPKLETKPVDHPFGPFADPYKEHQHKYGPFKDIQKFYSKQ
jgi:thiosulfate dehydrogenase